MDIVLPAVFGFIGVLVGGAIAALLELWRQVLGGRGAARIIRFEIQDNVNKSVLCVLHRHPEMKLTDDAWKNLRVQIASLVPEDVYVHLNTNYGGLFLIEDWIRRIQQDFDAAKEEIENWQKRIMLDASFLRQFEHRSRLAELVDLILGRPTFPPSLKGNKRDRDAVREEEGKVA